MNTIARRILVVGDNHDTPGRMLMFLEVEGHECEAHTIVVPPSKLSRPGCTHAAPPREPAIKFGNANVVT